MNDDTARWDGLKRFLVGRSLPRTLGRIAVLVLMVAAAYRWVLLPFRVDGDSMLPTLTDGSVHAAYRLAYRSHPPGRGDLVVLNVAGGRELLVKRLIGLPGERLAFRNGIVLINGEELEEPYMKLRSRNWNQPERALREDEYFFVGDNRSMDMPNHTLGVIRRDRILGKVVF